MVGTSGSHPLTSLVLLATLHSLAAFLTNYSMSQVTASLTHLVKMTEPLCTAAIATTIGQARCTIHKQASHLIAQAHGDPGSGAGGGHGDGHRLGAGDPGGHLLCRGRPGSPLQPLLRLQEHRHEARL